MKNQVHRDAVSTDVNGEVPVCNIDTGGPMSWILEILVLFGLFFFYAADPAPAVNEAHYLVKAKNFWDPAFCANDLFASSGKAHTTFYALFGWLTRFLSLEGVAWVGRIVGWFLLAIGLRRCCVAIRLPRFSCLAVAMVWLAGIEYGNLAGEWVVGGIEAKVPAYAFVLIGVASLIQRQWSAVWVWFGAASAFHVLTGGWAVLAGLGAFLVTERLNPSDAPRSSLFSRGLFVGGALSLFGLVPALLLTLDASAEQSAQAARIYSFVRIRHHLLPADFPTWWFVRHGVLVGLLLASFVACNRPRFNQRLHWFGVGAVLIAGVGLIIGSFADQAPGLAAKLLRYYWFRLTDSIVPLVLGTFLVQLSIGQFRLSGSRFHLILRIVATVLIFVGSLGFLISAFGRANVPVPPSVTYRLFGFPADANRESVCYSDWLAVCRWIRVAIPEDEVFLTPRHQQTFKWYAHRAEVVNWKDVPQDAASLVEWERRFYDVYPASLGRARVTINYGKLLQYRTDYGVRFMVVDNRIAGTQLPLVRIYPVGDQVNATFSVYELPYAR